MNIEKSVWSNGDHKINLAFPIAKVDKEKRTVSGFATLDNVDKHGDIITAEASKAAFDTFRGNLREMHQPIAVGKVVSFNEEDFYDADSGTNYKGVFVEAYISKGAEDTWTKVLDGTLTGFSIGGQIISASNKEVDDEEHRVITEYHLQELSLVDNPANPLANIFSIQKSEDGLIFKGMATEIETENVFWCNSDQVATSSADMERDCRICGDKMETIGWVEKIDDDKNHSIKKMVDSYLRKDDAPGPDHGPNNTTDSPSAPLSVTDSQTTINSYPDQAGNNIGTTKSALGVGSFVTWKSSGGKSYGKIKSVKTNGSVKVPDSSFEITGTTEDPAALITVYKKTKDGWKPTDTVVGHKLSTLKPAKKKNNTISKGGSIVANLSQEELDEYDQAEEINEVTEDSSVEAAEAAEVSEVEVDELDFTKMVTDLKDFVGEKLEKSIEKTKGDATELRKAFEAETTELTKKFDTVLAEKQELQKSIDTLTNLVKSLEGSLNETNNRLAMYENDTAIKKSGELDTPETKLEKTSIWQGHFLGVQDL